MSQKHTMQVTTDIEANGVVVATITAKIEVNYHWETGDGWDEPEEPAHFEMNDVTQTSGITLPDDGLRAWAASWVDDNQDEIWDDFNRDAPDAD